MTATTILAVSFKMHDLRLARSFASDMIFGEDFRPTGAKSPTYVRVERPGFDPYLRFFALRILLCSSTGFLAYWLADGGVVVGLPMNPNAGGDPNESEA